MAGLRPVACSVMRWKCKAAAGGRKARVSWRSETHDILTRAVRSTLCAAAFRFVPTSRSFPMARLRYTLAALTCAATFLASAPSQAQRGGGNAADSIKYKYASTPQLDALKAEAAK